MTEGNRHACWIEQCRAAEAIEVPVSALGGTGLRMSRQAANEGRLHASTKLQFSLSAPTTRVEGPQVVAHLGISPETECWKQYALHIPDGNVSADPPSPGVVYTAAVGDADRRAGIYRVEVSVSSGIGKLRLSGGMDRALRQACQRAFSYVQTHKGELGTGREVDTHDFFVEGVDLLGSKVSCEAGVAFFVALISALRRTQVAGATIVLGDISIQGNIKGLPSLTELVQLSRDNGARRVLVPTANRRQALELDEDLLELVSFYNDSKGAVERVLGSH